MQGIFIAQASVTNVNNLRVTREHIKRSEYTRSRMSFPTAVEHEMRSGIDIGN